MGGWPPWGSLALPSAHPRYRPAVAFHIRVYRLSDHSWVHHPPAALLEDPELLIAEGLARTLYENPLGSGHTVYEYWSSPAATLGLPLIAAIYEQGLEVAGSALDVLERELDVLERAWVPPLRAHLQERARFLREALRVAREAGGFVSIS